MEEQVLDYLGVKFLHNYKRFVGKWVLVRGKTLQVYGRLLEVEVAKNIDDLYHFRIEFGNPLQVKRYALLDTYTIRLKSPSPLASGIEIVP